MLYQTFFIDRDSQMVVIQFSKDQLRNIIMSLSQMMEIIKTKTGKIFIPTLIQNSPLNINTDMLVILRSIDKLDKFCIDSEAWQEEKKLARSFILRSFSFITSDPNERKI